MLVAILLSVVTLMFALPTRAPLPFACSDGQVIVYRNTAPSYLNCETVALVPSGSMLIINSGSCPTGYTEVSALDGKAIYGTVAANGNVGTTLGSDTITPTGSVSAPTFTGTPFSSVINHTHTITVTSAVQGSTTAATTGTHIMTSTATGGSARAPTSGDSFTATSANPGGGVSSITPAGTNSAPTFSGNSFDNRPAGTRVIFCKKD